LRYRADCAANQQVGNDLLSQNLVGIVNLPSDQVLQELLAAFLDAFHDGLTTDAGDGPRQRHPENRRERERQPAKQRLNGENIRGAGADAKEAGRNDLLLCQPWPPCGALAPVELHRTLRCLAHAHRAEHRSAAERATEPRCRQARDHGTEAAPDLDGERLLSVALGQRKA
jgi:hypothetical protein